MIRAEAGRILIVDDDPVILETFRDLLEREGYLVDTVRTGTEALERLELRRVDLVIADLNVSASGSGLIEQVSRSWPNVPIIVLTADADVRSAVKAMAAGASDYLLKPLHPSELLVGVAKGLRVAGLRTENSEFASAVVKDGRYGEIIGTNPGMREIFQMIARVAVTPSRILIQGEPGTGKELIARAIHTAGLKAEGLNGSAAADRPYMAVNCGAFARSLLESQLFGFKRGTFTGAFSDHEGVFVAAKAGTLFLDEITELDLDLQVKLLRAIQEQEVTPLGATQPVPIRARVITATNQPIAKLVQEGKFRADLYYRINVVNIQVPPLRDRVDDVPALVEHFVARTAKSYRVPPKRVSPEAMDVFQSYDWPGNVRELQNAIERAFALGKSATEILRDDLPADLLARAQTPDSDSGRAFPRLDSIVRSHLMRALQVAGGVKTRAADLLGIDRNRLYRLMHKYRIQA
ncbi:MAG: sigma-54-dependent transcriptional regulator [Planctomycetota bacterium]